MDVVSAIVGHLAGDYLLQNDWFGNRKPRARAERPRAVLACRGGMSRLARDSVLRYGESVGCELLNFFVRQQEAQSQSQSQSQSRKPTSPIAKADGIRFLRFVFATFHARMPRRGDSVGCEQLSIFVR